MKKSVLLLVAVLVVLATIASGHAAVLVVPTAGATQDGNGSWGFGSGSNEQVIQNLFQVADLGGLNVGDTIDALTFRNSELGAFPNSNYTFPTFNITLGEGNASLGSVFADNFADTPMLVRMGSLTLTPGFFPANNDPGDFGEFILFDTPYTYTGGRLLVEIRQVTDASAVALHLDALFNPPLTSGELEYSQASVSATTSQGDFDANIVMKFRVSPIPEPARALLLVLGAIGVVTRRQRP